MKFNYSQLTNPDLDAYEYLDKHGNPYEFRASTIEEFSLKIGKILESEYNKRNLKGIHISPQFIQKLYYSAQSGSFIYQDKRGNQFELNKLNINGD